MAREARPKIRAALMVADKVLRDVTATPGVTTSGYKPSSTKFEPVSLPNFKGAEKPGCSPFLDYEDKSRSNLLLSHLDKEAQRRIVGDENNYVKAMEKLDRYFGDKRKIVRDCVVR